MPSCQQLRSLALLCAGANRILGGAAQGAPAQPSTRCSRLIQTLLTALRRAKGHRHHHHHRGHGFSRVTQEVSQADFRWILCRSRPKPSVRQRSRAGGHEKTSFRVSAVREVLHYLQHVSTSDANTLDMQTSFSPVPCKLFQAAQACSFHPEQKDGTSGARGLDGSQERSPSSPSPFPAPDKTDISRSMCYYLT